MTLPGSVVIKSTSDLTPDKILGYAKGIAVTVGAVLTAVAEVIPDSAGYKRYLQAAILVCTVIATVAIPNAVKPVVVPPPAVNVEPSAEPLAPIPAAVLEEPPLVDPDPLLGVVNPPGKHEEQ
jgi:hypothetical protein